MKPTRCGDSVSEFANEERELRERQYMRRRCSELRRGLFDERGVHEVL